MILPLLLFCTSMWADAQGIQVTTLQGAMEAENGMGFQKVEEGANLKEGQEVRMQSDSTAILTYPNGTRVKLNANTRVKLHIQDGLDLIRGAVFAHVQKEKQKHFFVKTPSAVAGVRGTEFFTTYGGKNDSDGWLCVNEGEVEVTPINKPSVLVKAGFGIVVKANEKIDAPKKYEWTKHLNWNMDSKGGAIKDTTSPDSLYKDLLKHNYD